MNQNKLTLFLVALVIVSLAILVFILIDSQEAEIVIEEEGTGELNFGQSDVQEVEVPSIPAPNLNSVINYSQNFPSDARIIMEEKIAETRANLKSDSTLYETWIELGNQYKIVGDYSKAVESWEYAGVLSPNNSVSFHNLGDIYAYFLNDPVRAEENFLKAVSNSPFDPFYYIQTSEFYRLVLEDLDRAKNILGQGLEQKPDSEELKQTLNNINNL